MRSVSTDGPAHEGRKDATPTSVAVGSILEVGAQFRGVVYTSSNTN